MNAHENVVDTIGSTPLVWLQRLSGGLPGRVAIKLESRNPGGSVKDRIGRSMVLAAERAEFAGTAVVTVAPSTGERYLSIPLWEGIA